MSHPIVSTPRQADFLAIPETPFVYWLRPRFFELLTSDRRLREIVEAVNGVSTCDNERFLRCFWEVTSRGVVRDAEAVSGRWFWYAKAGRYQKWAGLEWLVVDWEQPGKAIKEYVATLPNTTHWSRYVRNESYYFQPGLTYSQMSRGSLGTRLLRDSIFDVKSIAMFASPSTVVGLSAFLSTRVSSYLVRVTTQNLEFHAGYVANLPLPNAPIDTLTSIGKACIALKGWLVSGDPRERRFTGLAWERTDGTALVLLPHFAFALAGRRLQGGLTDPAARVFQQQNGIASRRCGSSTNQA